MANSLSMELKSCLSCLFCDTMRKKLHSKFMKKQIDDKIALTHF